MSFDIEANFGKDFSKYPKLKGGINDAIAKWESIITSDLPDVKDAQVKGVGKVSADDLQIDFSLDSDLKVDAETTLFPEKGGFRPAYNGFNAEENEKQNALPFYSQVSFNDNKSGFLDSTSKDMPQSLTRKQYSLVAFHEIGHALGLTTTTDLYELFEISEGLNSGNPKFTGSNAVEAYNELLDSDEDFVPLTNEGGGHWDGSKLANEIMASGVNNNSVLSEVTLGALEDLGYDVDFSKADPGSPTPSSQPTSSESSETLAEDNVVAAATFTPDTANDSNDSLTGSSGENLLVGSQDDGFLTGTEGEDIFVIEPSQASQTISNFVDGSDYIGLSGGLGLSDINIVQGDGTLIQDNQSNTLAILEGIDANIISTKDFTLV